MGAGKILVIANPYEAARIAGWLEKSTLVQGQPVRTGDGSDETLSDFAEDPADVVVLSTSLASGDALALAGALRLEGPRHMKVILLGDDKGPVRTALDAVDYGADRFLRRPIAEKALVWAVKSCLEPKEGARATTVGGLAGGLGSAAATPGAASATAAALSALGDLSAPPAKPVPVAPAAVSTPRVSLIGGGGRVATPIGRAATPPIVLGDEDLGGLVAAASASTAPSPSSVASRLESMTANMIDAFLHEAVGRTVDAAVGAEVRQHVEYTAAEPGEAERELMEPSKTGDFRPSPEARAALAGGGSAAVSPSSSDAPTLDEPVVPAPPRPAATAEVSHDEQADAAPPWREPTLILSGGGASTSRPAEPPPSPLAPAAEPTSVAAPAPGNTIARELRATMSAIERRLFGETAAAGDEPDAEPDIDLDKLGVDTVPGFVDDKLSGPLAPAGATTYARDEGAYDDGGGAPAPRAVERAVPVPVARLDLAGEDAAALLARLHREGFTGRVTLRCGDAVKSVVLDAGRPVFAASNLPHDRMGDLLFREGKITREQHARSREIVAETGRRMGEILVEIGFLKRRELLPAVRRHVEDVIYSTFAWDTGSAELAPGDDARDEKIRLATHPVALIFEGIRRKMTLDRLRARVGGVDTVIAPLRMGDVAGALAEADLSLEERAAADLIDGRRTLADVAAATRLDEQSVYQLAYGLIVMGLGRALERGREHDGGGHTPAPTGAPVAAPSLAGAADVAIDRERVLAKHAHVLEADYFAVLGVRRDASAFEIKRAWEAARRDYAAESFPHEVQRELAEPLREISSLLDEAYHVLREGKVREQYLANLKE